MRYLREYSSQTITDAVVVIITTIFHPKEIKSERIFSKHFKNKKQNISKFVIHFI